MSITNIRSATLKDAAELAGLSTQLGYPTSTVQSFERLGAILETGEHAVLVACISDNTIVGWIHVFQALRVESDMFAELGGFVVAEGYRKRGIGRALFAAAQEWAMKQGMQKLRVRTRSGRAGARSFYERLGFELQKEQHVYEILIKTVGEHPHAGNG